MPYLILLVLVEASEDFSVFLFSENCKIGINTVYLSWEKSPFLSEPLLSFGLIWECDGMGEGGGGEGSGPMKGE